MANTDEMLRYSTSDIYFSSYLSAIDIPLECTETEKDAKGGNKIVFIFRIPKKDFNHLKASYFGGTGTVKAQRFVQSLRNLKSLCYI